MFDWFADLFIDIFTSFLSAFNNTINAVLMTVGIDLKDFDFNLTLFSDTPIISMTLDKLISVIIVLLITIFVIKLLYGWVKKFFSKIIGVFNI